MTWIEVGMLLPPGALLAFATLEVVRMHRWIAALERRGTDEGREELARRLERRSALVWAAPLAVIVWSIAGRAADGPSLRVAIEMGLVLALFGALLALFTWFSERIAFLGRPAGRRPTLGGTARTLFAVLLFPGALLLACLHIEDLVGLRGAFPLGLALAFLIGAQLHPRILVRWLPTRLLEDPALREEVRRLAERVGMRVGDVRVFEGESLQGAGDANAIAIGLGPSRRIFLTEGLLAAPRRQVLAVVAHELAHHGRRHVLRGNALLLSLVAATTLAARELAEDLPVVGATLSLAMAVAILPLARWHARRCEFDADRLAGEWTDPRHLADWLRGAPPVRPGPLGRLLATHPPAAERVARLGAAALRIQAGRERSVP